MDIEHISVSRKGCWDLCKQQYKYRYHLKIIPEGEQPFYFTYGKIIHKIAEIYVGRRGQSSLQECVKDVMEQRIPIEEGYEDKPPVFAVPLEPDYAKRMPGHLRALQKLTDQIGFGGILEHEFRFDLDPPHERYIKGFIDRLIQKGDQFFIIDYKTSKKNRFRKNRLTIRTDLQLRMYAKVVQREFDVPAKNIYAALHYLEGGDLIGARYTQESIDAAEQELLEAYKQIEETSPDDAWGNVGDHCYRCDYRDRCPFLRIT